jgi:predicted amidophosphoribosyltransferase
LLKLFHIKSFAVQVIPETAVSAEKPVTSALEKHADGFCSNCGAPMGSDDLVCGQCGQKKATVASPDPASPKKDD